MAFFLELGAGPLARGFALGRGVDRGGNMWAERGVEVFRGGKGVLDTRVVAVGERMVGGR